MKHTSLIARCFALLLALTLTLAPLTVMAEKSIAKSDMNEVNIWGIMRKGTVVYKDSQQKSKWGKAPKDVIANVVAYRGDLAVVKNGEKYGWCSLKDFKPLTGGAKLKSAQKTKVYRKASKKSRCVSLAKGVSVELVSLTDDWAQIRRGDNVGYVYVGHLTLKD